MTESVDGADVIAGRVLDLRDGHLVLRGVDQLDVAEGAGRLLDLAGDAFIALGAEAGGPFDGGIGADLGLPVRADLAQVIGEDVGGAAAIGAMDDDDVGVREG